MSKAEERACQYTGYCKNQSYKDYLNGYNQAEKDLELVAKIAREEVIKKAVKWLEGNAVSYLDKCDNPTYMGGYFIKTKELAEDFRKAMEENV